MSLYLFIISGVWVGGIRTWTTYLSNSQTQVGGKSAKSTHKKQNS